MTSTNANRQKTTVAGLLAACAVLLLAPVHAAASKQPVDFFGNPPGQGGSLGGQFGGFGELAVAVNDTGAGPANPGDVYVLDAGEVGSNRIQRFGRDDQGTPDPVDDTYHFISAWGADVDATPDGGTDYEVCTVAADCQAAPRSAGNGTPAGNGALDESYGIAVDQDTGIVYVGDVLKSFRINAYAGDGAFLRSFGYDVAASGPGDTGTGYEICVAAAGDVCRHGVAGSGVGQHGGGHHTGVAVSPPDGNPASGALYVADPNNRRVDAYALDGSSPSSIGSASVFDGDGPGWRDPLTVAVDSRGILYVGNENYQEGDIERYDSAGVNGPVDFLSPIAVGTNERQQLTVDATGGTFRLHLDPDGPGGEPVETTVDIPFDAKNGDSSGVGTPGNVNDALASLPGINGGRQIQISGGPGPGLPYSINFIGALGARNVPELSVTDGSVPLTGGSGASLATSQQGLEGLVPGRTDSLAVDPDSDGPGPDGDALYRALRDEVIQQFGPATAPGLNAPPANDDERHDTGPAIYGATSGLAVEPTLGRLYRGVSLSTPDGGKGILVYDDNTGVPDATLDSITDVTSSSFQVNATVDPNGPPDTVYRFEYRRVGDGAWTKLPEVDLGHQEDPQPITGTIDSPPVGLEPNTSYEVRLVTRRRFTTDVFWPALATTTAPAPPIAVTTGAPRRTTTSAYLTGRVAPRGSATSYHFEWGPDSSYGSTTPVRSAGSGNATNLVAEPLAGLSPGAAYHYRVVADNGTGGVQVGQDMTVTTFASELSLDHGSYPGPPNSDRAYELVSLSDTSGNPVLFGSRGYSPDGDRAFYPIAGGTDISDTGSSFGSIYYATRPSGLHPQTGWQTQKVTAPRSLVDAPEWNAESGPGFPPLIAQNGADALWRLAPPATPLKLFEADPPQELGGGVSQSRVVTAPDRERVFANVRRGSIDPDFPSATDAFNLYDVSAGSTPELVSLLPGGQVAPCGADTSPFSGIQTGNRPVLGGGSLLFFASQGAGPCGDTTGSELSGAALQLYLRDLDAGETVRVTPPPLSGPACHSSFLRGTSDGVFLATPSRLVSEDVEPPSCPGGSGQASFPGYDVYRYDLGADGLGDETLECVTCLAPGSAANVAIQPDGGVADNVSVSDDGSRIYFRTTTPLLPGDPGGVSTPGTYRLNLDTGNLAFVPGLMVGDSDLANLSPDGRFLAFVSEALRLGTSRAAALDPLGPPDVPRGNSTTQFYLYDDADGSVTCVSCPTDGSPLRSAQPKLDGSFSAGADRPNTRGLADDGTLVFATANTLVPFDQNAAGDCPSKPLTGFSCEDIYEWRDGRLVLVTPGAEPWSSITPVVEGITPDASSVFFTAAAALTEDAVDSNIRIYVARVGGGIDFPPATLPPCDLNAGACEGPPSAGSEQPGAGSAVFSGPPDPSGGTGAKGCPKGKHRVRRGGRTVCVAKKHGRRHKQDLHSHRRAGR